MARRGWESSDKVDEQLEAPEVVVEDRDERFGRDRDERSDSRSGRGEEVVVEDDIEVVASFGESQGRDNDYRDEAERRLKASEESLMDNLLSGKSLERDGRERSRESRDRESRDREGRDRSRGDRDERSSERDQRDRHHHHRRRRGEVDEEENDDDEDERRRHERDDRRSSSRRDRDESRRSRGTRDGEDRHGRHERDRDRDRDRDYHQRDHGDDRDNRDKDRDRDRDDRRRDRRSGGRWDSGENERSDRSSRDVGSRRDRTSSSDAASGRPREEEAMEGVAEQQRVGSVDDGLALFKDVDERVHEPQLPPPASPAAEAAASMDVGPLESIPLPPTTLASGTAVFQSSVEDAEVDEVFEKVAEVS